MKIEETSTATNYTLWNKLIVTNLKLNWRRIDRIWKGSQILEIEKELSITVTYNSDFFPGTNLFYSLLLPEISMYKTNKSYYIGKIILDPWKGRLPQLRFLSWVELQYLIQTWTMNLMLCLVLKKEIGQERN